MGFLPTGDGLTADSWRSSLMVTGGLWVITWKMLANQQSAC